MQIIIFHGALNEKLRLRQTIKLYRGFELFHVLFQRDFLVTQKQSWQYRHFDFIEPV